jgi:lipoprotein NlpI
VALFDQVLAIDPKHKYAYNAKGLAMEAEGKYSEALEAYNRSASIDPTWSQPLVNKMHALMALRRLNEAMKILAMS